MKGGSEIKPPCTSECSTGVNPRLSDGGLKRVGGVDSVSIWIDGELARLDCEG